MLRHLPLVFVAVCAASFFGAQRALAQDESSEEESSDEMDIAAPPAVGAKSERGGKSAAANQGERESKRNLSRRWLQLELLNYEYERVRTSEDSPSGTLEEPSRDHYYGFTRDDLIRLGLYGPSVFLLAGIRPAGFRYDLTMGMHNNWMELGVELDFGRSTSEETQNTNGAPVKTENRTIDYRLGLVGSGLLRSGSAVMKAGARVGFISSSAEDQNNETEDLTGWFVGLSAEYVGRMGILGRRVSHVHGLSYDYTRTTDERGGGTPAAPSEVRVTAHTIRLNVLGLRLGF